MKKFLFSSLAITLMAVTGWAIASTTSANPALETDGTQDPVDETSKIVNPNFDEGTNGWTSTGE